MTNVTRADVRKGAIRCFDGKAKVATLAMPVREGTKDATIANIVTGILLAAAYPTTPADLAAHLEAALDVALVRRGSVIPDGYRHQYGVDQNCGDAMAAALKDYCGGGLNDPLDIARLETVVDTNGIRDRYDVWATKGLNPGMLRMNTGNVLRGMLRNDKPVVVGDQTFGASA